MEDKYFQLLKSFFEDREVCAKAGKPLKDGACVELAIPALSKSYTFLKKNSRIQVLNEHPASADCYFGLTPKAVEEIVNFKSDDIGEYGIKIFGLIFSKDVEKKIVVKVRTGLLKLTMKGYLGIIPLGGTAVIKYLAKNGISLGKIKDILNKLKE